MKKKVLGIVISLFALISLPASVLADSVTVTGLKETIQEEINTFGSSSNYEAQVSKLEQADLSNYSESDDKINVYVFRGSTCSHCLDAIAYFASIIPEYGKYINVRTYETWNNKANANLMKDVASVMGDDASGVPYIVIGDKSFIGYQEAMNDEIQNQITATYNTTDKYDVMNHLSEKSDATKAKNNSTAVTIILVFIVLAGGAWLIYTVSKSK